MINSLPPDAALVRRIARDPAALGTLYRRHVDAVLAFTYRRCGDVELAADVTSETFAAAVLASKRYRPEVAPVRTWLFGIAHHKLTDEQRRLGAERRARARLQIREDASHDDDLSSLEARLDARAFGADVLALVADLPPAERAAVTAVVLDDHELSVAAAALGITVPTLRQRVRRGVKRLTAMNGTPA